MYVPYVLFIYSERTMSWERWRSCGKVWHVYCMKVMMRLRRYGLNLQSLSLLAGEKSDGCKVSYSTQLTTDMTPRGKHETDLRLVLYEEER